MTQGNSNPTDKIEIRKGYYTPGALRHETPYVNGKKHGTEKWYYKSGALYSEIPYVNGKRHGLVKHYNIEKSNIDRLALYNKDRMLVSLLRESYRVTLKPII